MRKINKCILFLAVSLAQVTFFFISQAHSRETFLSSDARIELTIAVAPDSMQVDPRVSCVLQNKSSQGIEYECSLDTHGLDFQLLDSQGQEIAMDKKWFRFHSPRNLETVSVRYCRLSPGEKLSFTLNLKEPFPLGWQGGTKLKVDWLSTGTPFAPPAVSGVCEIASLWTDSSVAENKSSASDKVQSIQPSSARSDAKIVNETSAMASEKPTLVVSWYMIVILIVVALGLIWLVLMLKKQR